MSDAHGSLIKNPKQLIQIVFAAFFVPLIVILLLLVYADSGVKKSAVPTNDQTAVIIKPVANLQFVDAKAPKVFKTGAAIYQNVCSSCHATGAAGAPAFENTAAWSPRIAHGYDSLLHSALKGKNAMPARAGTSPDDVSDYEIARAVVYMANSAGAKFAEPKEPAAEPPTAK